MSVDELMKLWICDHHEDGSMASKLTSRPLSGVQIIFDVFNHLDSFKPEHLPQLERFVKFVNIVDSLDYQVGGVNFDKSAKTLLGLYRNFSPQYIYEYFEDPSHTGFEVFTDEFIANTDVQYSTDKKDDKKTKKLKHFSDRHQENVNANISAFEKLNSE